MRLRWEYLRVRTFRKKAVEVKTQEQVVDELRVARHPIRCDREELLKHGVALLPPARAKLRELRHEARVVHRDVTPLRGEDAKRNCAVENALNARSEAMTHKAAAG